ncbi:complex I intermediate-associated protein [Sporothrix schenckii 1099-18]|uniref:Complex I intermediate-associated protein n=1 Tax=Sporothrix schenckii 1099-18 TaxID=1397361 RepID=A0A0F2MEZ0_SPOSC|nr:complex I intermediate-associated protein [Sporothrix schenckii 1099-18]KJR86726.1 complex I intermediate-associated protein [Sporothrix schenckii 1099-18]
MRSHLAARNAYRRCLVHGRADARPAVPSVTSTSTCSLSTSRSTPPTTNPVASPSCARPAPRPQRYTRRFTTVEAGSKAAARSFSTTSRRTFLGVLRSQAPREIKEQHVEPGYDVLLQFRASVAEDTRRPPHDDLVQAFRDFFAYKYQYGKRVNATQAQWFRRLYQYLRHEGQDLEQQQEQLYESDGCAHDLDLQDLRNAREALAKPPSSAANTAAAHDHLEMCREIYTELRKRGAYTPLDFKRHIFILCQYGASVEAAELLTKYWLSPQPLSPLTARSVDQPAAEQARQAENGKRSRRDKELWVLVLQGLANEGREDALLAEAKAAEEAGLEYMPLFHEIMTTFYARQNNYAKTREWFEKPIAARRHATAQTYAELLAFSQRSDGNSLAEKQMWVQATFQDLCDANPAKDVWDVIFQWAVVSLDKGVDEIRHMIATMEKHNANRPNMSPDAATVNGLIRVAAAKGDVLLAERFVQLGAAPESANGLDIAPDAQTFILQLDYRVNANDLSGAYASFMHLQSIDCPDEEDAPVINKYIRALCSSASASAATTGNIKNVKNTQRIRDVLDIAEHRQVALEPATVVSLCMTFFGCDQQFEVIDVLSMHAMQYSVEERAIVRDAFVEYIVDRKQSSTARAWDAYSLLRQYFAETPPASRVRVMDGFFRRHRPDMACYVFGHMRGADDPAVRPTADLYVRCLEGLGRWPDETGLKMVHNMLKMDTRVQMDTRLYNALMLAYAASGDRSRALDFWHEIDGSVEGPSYATLAILFYVCEGLPFGDATARSVWAKMQRMEVDVPPDVFDAYSSSIAGQGHIDEVQKLISGMEKSVGYGPTLTTLGLACNALPGQDLQASFADWAAAEYPDIWEQVKKRGCTANIDGLRRYKITRELKA